MKKIDEKMMLAAIWGGSFLGGGGGGDPRAGYALGMKALKAGEVYLALPEELPSDAYTATAGLVGSPKAGGLGPSPDSYVEAFLFLQKVADIQVSAVNSNEAGGVATVNGWFQAAGLKVPVLDAPANGRAHPTGLMGSMGLHRDKSYISRQAAVGRKSKIYVEGDIDQASAVVRSFSEREGLVAVARNPVTCDYAAKYGAKGAVSLALDLGFDMAEAVKEALGFDPLVPENVGGIVKGISRGASLGHAPAYGEGTAQRAEAGWSGNGPGIYAARAAAKRLCGQIVTVGRVLKVQVEVKGGFDVGKAQVWDGPWGGQPDWRPDSPEDSPSSCRLWTVGFMNEYLTLKRGGETAYSFPDLIVFFGIESGWPVSSADLKEGQEVAVVAVPWQNLILGDGMFDPALYEPLEKAIGERLPCPERRKLV